MNFRFRDPFASEIPDCIDGVLEEGCALNVRLNRWGTLLAAGCQDGRVVVWDVDTRTPAAVLPAHAAPVACTAFSRCGFYLASCATDGTLAVTALATGLPAVAPPTGLPPLLTVQFHPRDATTLLATRLAEPPLVLRLDYAAHTAAVHPLTAALAATLAAADPPPPPPPPPTPEEAAALAAAEAAHAARQRRRRSRARSILAGIVPVGAGAPREAPAPCHSAAWARRGDVVYVGSARGALLECDAATGALRRRAALGDGAGVRTIDVARSGHAALLNCTDRCVRVLDLRALAATAELRDDVSHQHFRRCAFSPTAEYIACCSTTSEAHDLGVWSDQGRLVRSVKGASGDRMVDLVWHPVRRALYSCGASGTIYTWATVATERWSVYAPTFTELDENEEYVEREDEFDFADGEVPRTAADTSTTGPQAPLPPPRKAPRVAAGPPPGTPAHIDITTVEPLTAYFSGSEDESAEDRAPQLRTIMPELKAFIDQDALVDEEDENEKDDEKDKEAATTAVPDKQGEKDSGTSASQA